MYVIFRNYSCMCTLMATEKYWFCDFEAYQLESMCPFVKEIALLSNDQEYDCTYHVKYPYNMVFSSLEQKTANVQYCRHRLPWSFGTYTFEQAIAGIQEHVLPHQLVFVKGLEKAQFLNQYIRNIRLLPEKPPMKDLNNCLDKVCWIPHGKYCARRKVHELCRVFKPTSSSA
jgi:hypothetical protein